MQDVHNIHSAVFLSPFPLASLSLSFFQYVKKNKEDDNDWFKLESNPEGTRWFGTCWTFIEGLKYEFDVEFDVSDERCFFFFSAA